MKKLKRAFGKVFQRVIDWAMGNGLMQEENQNIEADLKSPIYVNMLEEVATEGIVLLKNEEVLPISYDTTISVFGRCQYDSFLVGYGSGGDVHPKNKINLINGFKNKGIKYDNELAQIYYEWCKKNEPDHGWWGHWPYYYDEMLLTDDLVKVCASRNDIALIVVGRACGEDRDNKLQEGSYYLTKTERENIKKITENFKKTILLINSANIIDLSFIDDYKIDSILYAWQLGEIYGNAIANIICGKSSPSGKLISAIARKYSDYPSSEYFGSKYYNYYKEDVYVGYRYFNTFHKDNMLFPFGFGLTYSKFDFKMSNFNRVDNKFIINVSVKNIGLCNAKEVVQVYLDSPNGRLNKSKKNLIGFKKSKLLAPNEEEILSIIIDEYILYNYLTSENCYILEKGIYKFYLGNSCIDNDLIYEYEIKENIIKKVEPICEIKKPFKLLNGNGFSEVDIVKIDLKSRILSNLPESKFNNNEWTLFDVKGGKCSVSEFVGSLTDKDLSDLTHGEGGMNSSLGVSGNAGAFGGITPRLRDLGVKPIICADGPAGLRIRKHTHLLPCGSAIAATFNEDLVEKLFQSVSLEAKYHGIDVLLSPGMNIQRNPLCGRNFEYFSEDPVLTGKIAAAEVRGIQHYGVSACPKHFACNNQEYNRNHNDSIISERALREIYLKSFEIMIKDSNPDVIMTSYNLINGIYAHYNYDLCTTVLRKEWGYDGLVITDWWMKKSKSKEFPKLKNNAYRVRAQVDVLMPGNMSYIRKGYKFDKKLLKTIGKKDGLTKAELQRTAINVVNLIVKK